MNTDTPVMERPEGPGHKPEERKFLFDVCFDVEDEPEVKPDEDAEEVTEEAEPEEDVPSFSEDEMAAAREESFAQGKKEGIGEAAEATERDIVSVLASLEGQFERLFQDHEKSRESILETAISTAVSINRKVFPTLNKRQGLGEIERMIVMSMESILDEPRIMVYVNAANATILEDRIGGLATEASYKGEIKVVAADDISPGDCRVEWSGGGAKRDMTEMWQEIDEIVERNLSALDQAAPEDAEAPETTDEAHETTDEAPETTDEAPETTDEAPETTDEAPETTDEAPETTDEAGREEPEKQPEVSETSVPETLPEDASETPDGEDTATDPEGS